MGLFLSASIQTTLTESVRDKRTTIPQQEDEYRVVPLFANFLDTVVDVITCGTQAGKVLVLASAERAIPAF
jgi:hypothetical protein